MYISIKKAALKYDFHVDTMRNHLKNMEEGLHYIIALGRIRFDEEKLHQYLTRSNEPSNDSSLIDISKYLK